jgi:hypothetical protein
MSEHRDRRGLDHLAIVLAAGLSLFAAAPVAAADLSFFSPAAENPCGVDILVEADFLPTDRARLGYGDITFTNLETGATFLQRSRHTDRVTYVASTQSWDVTVVGRIWTPIYPGEPGPSGIVQDPGLWIVTDGKLEYTLDQNDALTAFSLQGSYADVCVELGA